MKQTAIKIQEIRLLANDEEVLDEANDILAEKPSTWASRRNVTATTWVLTVI